MLGRLARNKWLLCVALLFNQSAYVTLESIQSSLNQSKGTNALAVLYVCMVLSALFLPSFIISKLGCKKTLACSVFAYGTYIIANFYPTPFTLTTGAALLGVGAGVMWPTIFAYVTRMAWHASGDDDARFERLTKETFGIMYTWVNSSMVVGSLVMLGLLFATSFVLETTTKARVGNSTNNSSGERVCGLFYVSDDASADEGSALEVSDQTLYIILGGFLLLNTLAIILSLCLDDYGEITKSRDATCSSENSDSPRVRIDNFKTPEEEEAFTKEVADIRPPTNKEVSALVRLKSTMKLLSSDWVAILSVPHTMSIGMMQAFIRGTFFASWISCESGLYNVSYMMIVLSLSMTSSSFLSSRLLRMVNHRTLFGVATILELAGFFTLLLWRTGDPSWPYFLVTFAFGFGRSLIKTQTPSCVATLFPDAQDAAGSLMYFSEPIGTAITYAIMAFILPIHAIAFLIPMVVVAYASFVSCTFIQGKECRNIRCV